jgi:hypothetical protein
MDRPDSIHSNAVLRGQPPRPHLRLPSPFIVSVVSSCPRDGALLPRPPHPRSQSLSRATVVYRLSSVVHHLHPSSFILHPSQCCLQPSEPLQLWSTSASVCKYRCHAPTLLPAHRRIAEFTGKTSPNPTFSAATPLLPHCYPAATPLLPAATPPATLSPANLVARVATAPPPDTPASSPHRPSRG